MKVLPDGEVPQNLFENFPNGVKVFMVAPTIRCENSSVGRRSQLCESSPAGTLVDGSPRAWSWIFSWKNQFVFVRSIFPAATDIISWCMQNLSSIHRLSKKFEPGQGFTMVRRSQHGAYIAHERCLLACQWQFRDAHGVSGRLNGTQTLFWACIVIVVLKLKIQ